MTRTLLCWLLLCIIALPAQAGAVVTRYVNTASSGGDGTTNNTSGATAAYLSLNAAFAGLPTTLTDNVEILVNGGADSTAASLSGITSGSYTITIKPVSGTGHTGTWCSSCYRLAVSTTDMLDLQQGGVIFDGIQFDHVGAEASGNWDGIYAHGGSGTNIWRNCLFRGSNASGGGTRRAFNISTSQITHKIYNNTFYGFTLGTDSSAIIIQAGSGTNYIRQNTFDGNDIGINYTAGAGTVYLGNNIFSNHGTASVRTAGTTPWGNDAQSDYNVATDAGTGDDDLPGSHSVTSATITFTDAANGDYHTSDSDALLNHNLYSDADTAITTDFEGDARPSSGAVEMGADEPDTTATPTPTPTPAPTPTPSPTPTASPTPTVSPSPTVSPTPTPAATLLISDGLNGSASADWAEVNWDDTHYSPTTSQTKFASSPRPAEGSSFAVYHTLDATNEHTPLKLYDSWDSPGYDELYAEWYEYFETSYCWPSSSQKMFRTGFYDSNYPESHKEFNVVSQTTNGDVNFVMQCGQWGNSTKCNIDDVVHSDIPHPVGKWVLWGVHIKMNTPGSADGFIRLYRDGALYLSKESFAMRGTDTRGLNYVWFGGNYSNYDGDTLNCSGNRYIDYPRVWDKRPASTGSVIRNRMSFVNLLRKLFRLR